MYIFTLVCIAEDRKIVSSDWICFHHDTHNTYDWGYGMSKSFVYFFLMYLISISYTKDIMRKAELTVFITVHVELYAKHCIWHIVDTGTVI